MAMIAAKCPEVHVVVVDLSKARIDAWNTDDLPIYEPGLLEFVKISRGRYVTSARWWHETVLYDSACV